MLRASGIFLAVFIVTPAFSQTKVTSETYLRGPFVLKTPASLGPGFLGHDIRAVVSSIEKVSPGEKSEFETTAQYEARKASFGQRIQQEYVFVNDPAVDGHPVDDFNDVGVFVYDADEESMDRTITMFDSGGSFVLRSGIEVTGQYVGVNAFGVRATIHRFNKTIYQLRINEKSRFFTDNDGRWTIRIKIPMKATDAIVLKSRLRIALACSISGSEIERDDQITKPTITNPAEIHWNIRSLPVMVNTLWVFDKRTGHILKTVSGASATPP